jgi:hypothetical protein
VHISPSSALAIEPATVRRHGSCITCHDGVEPRHVYRCRPVCADTRGQDGVHLLQSFAQHPQHSTVGHSNVTRVAHCVAGPSRFD